MAAAEWESRYWQCILTSTHALLTAVGLPERVVRSAKAHGTRHRWTACDDKGRPFSQITKSINPHSTT